jgi:hypothetical protein
LPIIGQTGKKLSAYLKPVLVLVISILIFAGIAYLADNELIDFIQTRFYNPSVVNSYIKENTKDAELSENHIFELRNKFAQTLEEEAVRSSFHYNQDPQDIYERSRIFGILLESTIGLQSVQFVDSNGMRIHYSTSSRDIITQNAESTSYRNYTEVPLALPYDTVKVLANETPKYTMDDQGERIIFSYPFIDSMDVYRGTALFSVSVRALAEKLVAEGRMKVNEDVSIVSSPPGILFRSPDSSKTDIFDKVSHVWNEGRQGRVTLSAVDSGVKFSLISLKTGNGLFFGHLVNDSLFSISDSMKLTLYLSMFLTFYLTLYFLLNLKANPVTVVRNRITRLKDNLFQQLYVNKNADDRAKWLLELEQRRDEIRSELKSHLKLTRRSEKTVDGIIDKSWDELLAVMKAGVTVTVKKTSDIPTEEEAEELEQLEEPEEFEQIEEAEELDEIEEAEEIEELIEEAEEIEELGETEEVKEPEDLEQIVEVRETGVIEEPEIDELEKSPSESKIIVTNIEISEDIPKPIRRGLLALASEIEFNREYPTVIDEPETIDDQLDIVSPFASMFSSLDEKKSVKKERKPRTKKKKEEGKKEEKKPRTRKKKEN